MRIHQQHYSFQNVYKKIKSQFNNTCVCSDRTKQIKHESPAKFMFINGYRDGSATGLIQNLAANIWKQEKRKKKQFTRKMFKIKLSTTETQTFVNLFTVQWSLIKINTLASFFSMMNSALEPIGKNVSSERLLICRSDKQTI